MIAPPEPIRRYCDAEGRLHQWPASKRKAARAAVLQWLSEHFEPGRDYSEAQVNVVLNELHTFGDPALLRREMFDSGFINRTPDVRRYWRPSVDEAPN